MQQAGWVSACHCLGMVCGCVRKKKRRRRKQNEGHRMVYKDEEVGEGFFFKRKMTDGKSCHKNVGKNTEDDIEWEMSGLYECEIKTMIHRDPINLQRGVNHPQGPAVLVSFLASRPHSLPLSN